MTSSLHENSAFELASGFLQAPTNMGAIGYTLLGEAFWAKRKNNACDVHGEAFWASGKTMHVTCMGKLFGQSGKTMHVTCNVLLNKKQTHSNFNDMCCDRFDSLYPHSIA